MKSDKLNNITLKLKNCEQPVLIFGAGAAGQVLLQSCIDQGITVEGFCDDNIKKKGTVISNTPVYHTHDIKRLFPTAHFIISAADIHDMIEKLHRCGYDKSVLHSAIPFLESYDLGSFYNFQGYTDNDTQRGFVEFAVKATLSCQEGFVNVDKVFMRSVDIVVTEKCSLKCKDCSNLMQFFENPINYREEDLKEAIDLLSQFADDIHEVRVIGGEPLMNKQWHLVVENLTSKPNIQRVVIYTNGMIKPKPEQVESLKNDKVIFMITDYTGIFGADAPNKKTENLAKFKKKVDQLEELCKQEGIDYRRHPPENWTDCGRIENFNRTIEENKEVFRSCCCKNLITLSEGELHRCPFSAQITRLNVINEPNDYVVLSEKGIEDQMKQDLRSLLFEKDYIEACNYCPGRRLSDEQIVPAVQAEKVLPILS